MTGVFGRFTASIPIHEVLRFSGKETQGKSEVAIWQNYTGLLMHSPNEQIHVLREVRFQGDLTSKNDSPEVRFAQHQVYGLQIGTRDES
jgi:hypothetical protein